MFVTSVRRVQHDTALSGVFPDVKRNKRRDRSIGETYAYTPLNYIRVTLFHERFRLVSSADHAANLSRERARTNYVSLARSPSFFPLRSSNTRSHTSARFAFCHKEIRYCDLSRIRVCAFPHSLALARASLIHYRGSRSAAESRRQTSLRINHRGVISQQSSSRLE